MKITPILLLALVAVARPGAAQTPVQVQGLEQVTASLRSVEDKLDRLLVSSWEYLFLQRNLLGETNMEERIQRLGLEGWELVGVTVEEGFIFKRRAVYR